MRRRRTSRTSLTAWTLSRRRSSSRARSCHLTWSSSSSRSRASCRLLALPARTLPWGTLRMRTMSPTRKVQPSLSSIWPLVVLASMVHTPSRTSTASAARCPLSASRRLVTATIWPVRPSRLGTPPLCSRRATSSQNSASSATRRSAVRVSLRSRSSSLPSRCSTCTPGRPTWS